MKEIWKDIPNYKGYQVSNKGRVRTKNKTTYTKKHGIRHWKDRILKYKSHSYKTGYRVDLWKDGKPESFLVARLEAFTFYNKDINNHKLTVDYVDGNRFNNNLNNLELVTLKENIQRAFNNNLYTSQKNVKIINKKTNEERIFMSLSKGSEAINKNKSYLSLKIKNNKYENKEYKWEIMKRN